MRFAALLAIATFAAAQTPDRAPRPEEWGYRPAENATVAVNPPAFSWVSDGAQYRYDLQWARSADFSGATMKEGLKWSVYTHNRALTPGAYFWRYRIVKSDGGKSAWSRARQFKVPAGAMEFPQPSMDELRARIPKQHPRLFVTAADLPKLREFAAGAGRSQFEALRKRGDALLTAEPTPEPTVMGNSSNPETVAYWWPNRMQTVRACQEAETLAFLYLMTGEAKYGAAARKWTLHLAAWNPDGPTNWRLNDEAAMPILHRMARAYDWAYAALNEEDRGKVRAALGRRAADAWKGGQTGEGWGHLNRPYNSHGNRSWHKLAENALATWGESPESEKYLDFAVTKFFGAYPVWADEDGGWHEGLAYWAGYMTKIRWWIDMARTAFGIDSFRKPYFAHFADYALYTAPPGSPESGLGDLAFRPPSPGWSFVGYFAAAARNPYWTWWNEQWKIPADRDEPALGFLWSSRPVVAAKAPADLPPSKLFRGVGVAILNTTLIDSANNVQVRFKSSPFGRQSHGHDPHNAFTLNAYGEALLVNNVYRDLYGSPFHKGWCWSTKSQNALLVNGEGQRAHTANPDGKIVVFETNAKYDYVVGDATAAYEGKVKSYRRHILFAKPDVVVVADEVEPAAAGTLQVMLHAQAAFDLDQAGQSISLERSKAGVVVNYAASAPFELKQWTGYSPEPNWKYLKDASKTAIPPQWHVEASVKAGAEKTWLVTVLRPYRKGRKPSEKVEVKRAPGQVTVRTGGRTLTLPPRIFSTRCSHSARSSERRVRT
jgi:hypothetical protein